SEASANEDIGLCSEMVWLDEEYQSYGRKAPFVLSADNALSPFLFAPFFLLFALHGRRIGVLHFEPIRRAAGTISGVLAVRDNAFKPKLAGMDEYGRAVALDMLIEPDAGLGFGHDRCERGLANLKRITPQVALF